VPISLTSLLFSVGDPTLVFYSITCTIKQICSKVVLTGPAQEVGVVSEVFIIM